MTGELDQDAESYKAKWQARLRLSDREALSSYMRGVAADAAGYAKLDDDRRDQTYLSIRVDDRGLDAAVSPRALHHIIREWQGIIDGEKPSDPRQFTKDAIVSAIARNVHLEGDTGLLVISAAVWIAAQDRRISVPLHQGDVTLFLTFTFDDNRRQRRMQIELGFRPESQP